MRSKNKGDKPIIGKSAQLDQSDSAAADLAKYHLRNDKDLNKAYPLNEKIPASKSFPKGE